MSFLGPRNAVSIGVSQHLAMGGPNLLNKLSPSLLLTFAGAQTLDPRITFTRASTATFTGSNGLIQTAAINAPRFDYNPTTLAPLGLLIEEQRTNLLLNTSVLGTQVVTVTAAAHTLSFYGTGTIVLSGAFTGTVTGTGAYPTRTILTFTPIVGVLTVTVTGSVTSAQLEAGAFPTSYIPTSGTAVTRAADLAVMTGTGFSDWYNPAEGTLFVDGSWVGLASFKQFVNISDGTTNNLISIQTSTSPAFRNNVISGGAAQAAIGAGSFVAGTNFKAAISFKAGQFAASFNGAAPDVDTTGVLPSVNQLVLGAIGANTSSVRIKHIAYFPRRLANSQLQAITS